jgi:hypothetical protein
MRKFMILTLVLLGKSACAVEPPQFIGLFGGIPACGLVDAACPIIGAQDCCGDQLTECVDDGTGTDNGIVELKNCTKGKICIEDPAGAGGACGKPTTTS